ncbi:hypothetical protein [Rickettsiella endosymbiont of Litargus connexus]|jgi:hypothetical protein|uniref:hypothetical protein n=1 Tax=Rickettsiella endosymbiont of Litargus connexus TaxID=3066237 RepID=UPI0027E5DF76|nr:hypothetical protein [Gammaproteobacteria bacterium]MDD4892480.1 hypothetical protein [Candidatus Rickettsiella isopodorum]MDD5162534.1 hypothetical protein [Candidatus Rickettsiella isopodorum]MDQ5900143.1 hypothetical protein [Pseudomonadota bacterium]
MHKFIKPLSDAKKRKEVEEQKQREIGIEKLKANFPLYGKVINSDDKNIAKLSVYDEEKLFQAGVQKKSINPVCIDRLKKMGYSRSDISVAGQQEIQATVPGNSTASLKK